MTATTPGALAAEFGAMGINARELAHRATVVHGAMLQRAVVANASGRPGPEAPTGDYRRSINRRTEKRAAGSITQVGTDKPQARRLEHGFVGVDSLGRSYDQPPYPHFGPAFDEVAPKFEAAIEAIPGITATRRGL